MMQSLFGGGGGGGGIRGRTAAPHNKGAALTTTTTRDCSSSGADRPPTALAIFDFDCTLTTFHVWGRFKQTPLDQIPIDRATTFVDADAFRDFVATARDRDAKVAIATFGRRDVVDKALRVALGDEAHGLAISTPADHFDPRFELLGDEADRPRCAEGSDVLGDKNAQIDALCERFGLAGRKSLVFLADDDAHNVAAALEHGVFAEHTPHGADRRVLARLLARIPENKKRPCPSNDDDPPPP
mmetsp:Transcript_20720/g.82697  ORF Transcript_20720/g.82697 Transcript_20720/m.82697 type:complete len:242 (-) Transcript_20720:366-1091(-)